MRGEEYGCAIAFFGTSCSLALCPLFAPFGYIRVRFGSLRDPEDLMSRSLVRLIFGLSVVALRLFVFTSYSLPCFPLPDSWK